MLSQRDVAIVSPVPGTTRDVVSVALDLDGIKAVLSDTAGLRSTTDAVEQIGISRAAASVGEADLKVLVLPLPPFAYPWTDVRALLEEELVLPHVDGETIVLFNQVDLLPPSFGAASGDATPPNDAERARRLAEGVVREWMPAGPRWWVGSVETGEGMDAFLEHGLNAAVKRKYVCNRVARSPSDFPPTTTDTRAFPSQSVARPRGRRRASARFVGSPAVSPRAGPFSPARLWPSVSLRPAALTPRTLTCSSRPRHCRPRRARRHPCERGPPPSG
jgi:hypothetical protein